MKSLIKCFRYNLRNYSFVEEKIWLFDFLHFEKFKAGFKNMYLKFKYIYKTGKIYIREILLFCLNKKSIIINSCNVSILNYLALKPSIIINIQVFTKCIWIQSASETLVQALKGVRAHHNYSKLTMNP